MMDTTGKPGNPSNVMAEDETTPEEQTAPKQTETGSLPLSMWGGRPVKEGDVFQVKVISVDQESGTANVEMAGYGSGGMRRMRGSDKMAEEFDQPRQQGGTY